eukprot:448685-Hanusia_phi.AAC.1
MLCGRGLCVPGSPLLPQETVTCVALQISALLSAAVSGSHNHRLALLPSTRPREVAGETSGSRDCRARRAQRGTRTRVIPSHSDRDAMASWKRRRLRWRVTRTQK